MTINAAYDPWGSGVTILPSVEPGQVLPMSPDMTFLQRIQNILVYLFQLNAPSLIFDNIVDTAEFAPDKEPRTLSCLYAHSEMVLVNLETNYFDYQRISAPHFRYIAGASASRVKTPVLVQCGLCGLRIGGQTDIYCGRTDIYCGRTDIYCGRTDI